MSKTLDKRTNVSNKMYGRYRAAVVDIVHPDGLYMVSVRVLGLWDDIPDRDLPFAEFLLPLGAKPNGGQAVPVEKHDLVWVEFPRNGDSRFPLVTGSVYHAPNYQSNLPNEVNGVQYSPKRYAGEPTPPVYHRKDDLYQRFGFREHKTHEGGWSITHMASGTAIEITKDGKLVIHTEGDQFQSATGKHLGQYGELEIKVKGNATVLCDGDGLIQAKGNATMKSDKDITLDAKSNITLKAGGTVSGSASGYDFK